VETQKVPIERQEEVVVFAYSLCGWCFVFLQSFFFFFSIFFPPFLPLSALSTHHGIVVLSILFAITFITNS